jgi:hypothetical protein
MNTSASQRQNGETVGEGGQERYSERNQSCARPTVYSMRKNHRRTRVLLYKYFITSYISMRCGDGIIQTTPSLRLTTVSQAPSISPILHTRSKRRNRNDSLAVFSSEAATSHHAVLEITDIHAKRKTRAGAVLRTAWTGEGARATLKISRLAGRGLVSGRSGCPGWLRRSAQCGKILRRFAEGRRW